MQHKTSFSGKPDKDAKSNKKVDKKGKQIQTSDHSDIQDPSEDNNDDYYEQNLSDQSEHNFLELVESEDDFYD